MSLKAKVEAIIYAAEEPVTLEQISLLLKDVVLADLAAAKENAAIEQADSAIEPQSVESQASEAGTQESELLPELAIESAELICPESGPLMPQAVSPADTDDTVSESDSPEEAALTDEFLPEPPADDSLSEEVPEIAPAVSAESAPAQSASVTAPETSSRKRQPKKTEQEIAEEKAVRARVREVLVELLTDYANEDRGMEIRQVAGGFRMATKPEHHDVVRAFAKSLKPPIRLSLAALETLAVIAYKQPITAPEIADIRGVESASVLGTLLDRKLISTAGRKQVIGRPMQYKTSKDFLLRFGLNDVNELPSMEEFSQLASDGTIEIAPAESQEAPSLFEPDASGDKSTEGQPAAESALNPALPVPEPQESAEPQAEDAARTNNAAEAVDSQPQSETEPSTSPEAEHPIGHQ